MKMRKKIFGMSFEEATDYTESEGEEVEEIELSSKHLSIWQADGIFVVYDSAGAQLVFGDGKLLTRED